MMPDDDLIRLAAQGEKMGLLHQMLSPLLVGQRPDWHDDIPFLNLVAVLSQKGGNIDRIRQGLLETAQDLGLKHRMGSDRTLRRHVKDYGRSNPRRDLDYIPSLLNQDADRVLASAFVAAHGIRPSLEFYINLDGTGRAFFGDSWTYMGDGKKEARTSLTVAGMAATGAFKGQKNGSRGAPTFRGTVHKLDWFQMTAHVYDSKESFPLASRQSLVSAHAIDEFISLVDALPARPKMILADKEFCNYVKTARLRLACDDWGTILMLAAPMHEANQVRVLSAWHDGLAQRIPGPTENVFFAAQEHVWRGRPDARATLITYYFQEDPRKDKSDEDENLLRLPNGMYAISFVVNVQVGLAEAWETLKRYRDRWAIECVSKRLLAYTGSSYSQGIFMRDLLYQASTIVLAAYGLWRLVQTKDNDLRLHDPQVSHSRFFGAIHNQAVLALLKLKPN